MILNKLDPEIKRDLIDDLIAWLCGALLLTIFLIGWEVFGEEEPEPSPCSVYCQTCIHDGVETPCNKQEQDDG